MFQAMFVIWTACYTSVTMALFGTTVYSFSDLHLSLGNTVGLFTGQYHQYHMEPVGDQGNMLAWRLVIISFLILALGSLTAYVSNATHTTTSMSYVAVLKKKVAVSIF